MANYPSVDIDNSTVLTPSANTKIDYAEDGTVRGTVGFAAALWTGRVIHRYITKTEVNTIMAFWEANKLLPFTFAYSTETYTMRFTRMPQPQHLVGNLWQVTVDMIGTQD